VSVARILEEPVAAASVYGLQKKDGVNYIIVYDFGGGTLDVSVLYVSDGGYVEVMGSDGDNSLGGVDFDTVAHELLEAGDGGDVVERVGEVLTKIPLCMLSSFHTIGEKMKISLSSESNGEDTVHGECFGLTEPVTVVPESIPDLCSLLQPIELTLTLDRYNEVCTHLYERSMLPIRRILKDMNLEKEEIDEVVMVGGNTRIPQIQA